LRSLKVLIWLMYIFLEYVLMRFCL